MFPSGRRLVHSVKTSVFRPSPIRPTLNFLTFFSHLDTISTSLWASFHHHFPVGPTICFQPCQLSVHIFQIFRGVVNPSTSKPPFFSSPVQPCPSFILRVCLLLFCWSVHTNQIFLYQECWYLAHFGILLALVWPGFWRVLSGPRPTPYP